MQQIIAAKLKEFREIKPSSSALDKWIKDSSLWYWLYTAMRINGTPLDRGQILSILDGELIENLPLDTYSFIHNYAAMYNDMLGSIQMQTTPDLKLLGRWYQMLFEEEPVLRRDNPVIYQWDHVPVHFLQLKDELQALLRRFDRTRWDWSPIDRAVLLHLEFLKLYPYGEQSVCMAGALMMYSLLEDGFPLPGLSANEQDYNVAVGKYINKGDAGLMTDLTERGLLNRLESVIEVCRQAAEANE